MIHGGNVWQGNNPKLWLDFSANVRPEGAPDWVRQAVTDAMEHMAYYPEPQPRRCASALADFLGLDSSYVLPTAGGISAISLAAALPFRRSIVLAPCFTEYAARSAVCGKAVESFSLLGKGHALLTPSEALADIRLNDAALWLCDPLNPVGTAFARREIEALLRRAEDEDGWLVVDEAFIEYCPAYSVRDLVGQSGRLIVLGSMTKIFGVAGVRLGYLCAGAAMDMLREKQNPWEINCFAEAIALACAGRRAEADGECERNVLRREQLTDGLQKLGVFVYPSDANFLLADFGRDVSPIVEKLREKHILVRECTDFAGLDDGRHLRLAVKDEASNEKLLHALREVTA